MLIHITPKMFLAYRNEAPHCELIDLTIDELGLVLEGGKELTTKRPYPNKNYLVGCRKFNKKAIAGILINTQQRLSGFTMVARWAVNANAVVSHKTNYILIDDDYDTVSDNMMLWHGTCDTLGGWRCDSWNALNRSRETRES